MRFLFVGSALCALGAPLAAQQPQTLDTVRVNVASHTGSPLVTSQRSVQVITKAELRQRAGRSLQEILATALDVDVYGRSPAQADLAIRGSSIEQVVVMVNGVRVSDEQAGHYDLDLAVPMAMVERIEILRGTGATLYGPDAIGGIVNIVTRSDTSASDVQVGGGSFGTARTSLMRLGSVGRVSLQAGGDIARSDGHRSDTDYRISQARLGAAMPIGLGRLSADAAVGVRDFGADAFYGPYTSYEDTHTSTASVQYSAPLSDRWTVNANASGRRHLDLFTLERANPALYQNHHDNWQTAGGVTARYLPGGSWTLAFGADGQDARLVSARLGDHVEDRSAAFTELALGSLGGLSGDVGARVDHSSEYGDFFSPALSVSAPLPGHALVHGSVNRGFRSPTWTERFYMDPANFGSPDLHPERFWAQEAGVRISPTRQWSLDATAWFRQATDLIDWARQAASPEAAPWNTMNFASARYRGVELTAQALDVADADWTLRASGLSFSSSAAPGLVGKYALRPVTRTLGLTSRIPLGPASSVLFGVTNGQRATEPAWTRVDVRLSHRVRALTLTADLMNLTGARYLDASGVPVPGRSAFAGLRWSAP